jgi:translation initiation factor 1
MPDNKSKLVYSTGQTVPRKEKEPEKIPTGHIRPSQQRVTVRLDRKSRGGKAVTVIEGLLLSQRDMETLLKQLKSKLGTGGTLKDDSLEIQGDHRTNIISILEVMGYRPKRSGG